MTKLERGGYNKTGNDSTKYTQAYNFEYDKFGNMTKISVGSNAPYTLGSYSYGAKNGLLTKLTYGNGNAESYSYDNYGRKIQTTKDTGRKFSYSYAGDGQLEQLSDPWGALLYRYNYDTLGRLIGSSMKLSGAIALQTQHQYDDSNRLKKQSWALPGKTYQEEYSYDGNGRLTRKHVLLPTSDWADLTPSYDKLSRIWQVKSPAATTIYNFADALGYGGTTNLVSQMSVTSVHADGFERLYYKYSYDAADNIRTETKLNVNGTEAEKITYTYDKQQQLTQAASTLTGNWDYQYDTYGNIRSKTHGGDTISYSYGDANWRDLLTAVSGKRNGQNFSGSYTYDKAGNPTSYFNPGDLSTWTLSWKNGRELGKAVKSGTTLSFDYDVNGLRTWKQVDGVRHNYTYASGLLLRESYSQNGTDYTLDFLYDLNNRPYMLYLTTKTGSTTTSRSYYYILNLQGDVVHLVNTAGKAMASYTYDPYGAILTKSGEFADLNPIRYRGYYYDTETGFYYLQSRYYDPALGRFINADSYTSTGTGYLGYNMFAYCENRPIIASDPKGEFFFTAIAIGFAVGVAVQYAGDVVDNVQSGATGVVDILTPHSSIGEYLGSGAGCAIAAIPGGFLATVGCGAAGSVVTDLAKGNITSTGDALKSAALGAAFNGLGYGCQRLAASRKVNQIRAMPRVEKKRVLKTVYQNRQAFVNCNLRAFEKATQKERVSLLCNSMYKFKVGLYSTASSGLFGKMWEMMTR